MLELSELEVIHRITDKYITTKPKTSPHTPTISVWNEQINLDDMEIIHEIKNEHILQNQV